jgi:D-alanyl-D-alanine carboxypeptidase (penicillin-binding protein 5/6)
MSAVVAEDFGALGQAPTNEVLPIASMTKVITALMVLKAHPLAVDEPGPTITFGQADVDQIDEVITQNGRYSEVSVGDTTTERDALYALLLNSSNNIANSLAIWAYGSMDAFLAETKAWLAEQGLNDTVVADASGLNPATRSSSADLIAIGKLALADPALAAIVKTRSIELQLFGELVNGNTLIGTAGITGIKTGTTVEAGSCLLYSATFSVARESITLIGVTTGAALQVELQPAVAAYVTSLESGFHETVLADPSQPVATVTTLWNTMSNIVPKKSVSAVTWSDTPVGVEVRLGDIRGGGAGTTVGTMTFDTPRGEQVVDLVLENDLTDPGPLWRFSHVAQLFG